MTMHARLAALERRTPPQAVELEIWDNYQDGRPEPYVLAGVAYTEAAFAAHQAARPPAPAGVIHSIIVNRPDMTDPADDGDDAPAPFMDE